MGKIVKTASGKVNQLFSQFKRVARCAVSRLLLIALRCKVDYSLYNVSRLKQGRCIVVANHVSLLDGLLIALSSPAYLTFGVDTEFSRSNRFTAKALQLLSMAGFGEVVPIDSTAPFGLRTLNAKLCKGQNVMIFPEGRISVDGRPAPAQPGLNWLADRSNAEVIPLTILGAERSRIFAKSGDKLWPRIVIHF